MGADLQGQTDRLTEPRGDIHHARLDDIEGDDPALRAAWLEGLQDDATRHG